MTLEDQNEIKKPTGDWRALWILLSIYPVLNSTYLSKFPQSQLEFKWQNIYAPGNLKWPGLVCRGAMSAGLLHEVGWARSKGWTSTGGALSKKLLTMMDREGCQWQGPTADTTKGETGPRVCPRGTEEKNSIPALLQHHWGRDWWPQLGWNVAMGHGQSGGQPRWGWAATVSP